MTTGFEMENYYMAPDLLKGRLMCGVWDESAESEARHSELCDVWSCGSIMFTVLCGYPPFRGASSEEIAAKAVTCDYTFEARDWQRVSEQARQLVRMMLTLEPRRRCTAEQALNHAWVKDHAPKADDVFLDASFT